MRRIVPGRANGNMKALMNPGTVPSPPMAVIPGMFWPPLVFLGSASDVRAATMSSSIASVQTKSIRPSQRLERCSHRKRTDTSPEWAQVSDGAVPYFKAAAVNMAKELKKIAFRGKYVKGVK